MTASSPTTKRSLPVVPSTGAADFHNDAIAGTRVVEHESAAHEKRNWVRLSYDCNNRCTFCLDSNAHDGTMRANDEIKIQIIEGKRKGAERLILSGGEPTMHPNFLDFVLLGKRAGYRKVQTVTNGRMFKYPQFLETAAQNGLDEITFSLHGHTAKLHDALVGTPGAFVEETAGLKAALASGRFIVNVDIVINKQNIKHLPEMLETFIGWGVKEFDLLHVIPFGNAWSDARDHLFYDLDGNLEHLQKTFAYARRPDVHIWLNRFPPPYAEGFEDLIQDPYKLNDEVRGRREEFDRFISLGQKLSCREPARCRYCYLQSLCDTLDVAIDTTKLAEVDVVRIEAGPALAAMKRGKLPKAKTARVVAEDLARAEPLVEAAPCEDLELELGSFDGIEAAIDAEGRVFGKRLVRCRTSSTNEMHRLLAMARSFEVCVALTKATASAIVEMGAPPARLAIFQPSYDRVSDAHANDVDAKAFFASYPHHVAIEDVPECVSGRAPRARPRTLDLAMLAGDGRVDMPAYAKRYVADGFTTKALRCKDCSKKDACRGVHVNWVRAHGFAALEPISVD